MTQAERRAETRKRLLEAAGRTIAERGVQAVTIEEISADAGLSRGAFYAHFPDKDALIYGLLEKMRADLREHTRGLIERAVSPAELFDELSRVSVGHSRASISWILLFGEFRLHAIRDRKLRPLLASYYRDVRRVVANVIEQQFEILRAPLFAPAEDLASVVIAIDEGLAGQREVDRRAVSQDLFLKMLQTLFQAAVAASRG